MNIAYKIFVLIIPAALLPFSVQAKSAIEKFRESLNKTAAGTGHTAGAMTSDNLPETIGGFIGVLLSLVGVIFLVLAIYGGFLWMTAAGEEAQITKAKGIIKNSIIGLFIVLAAYAITAFIGGVVWEYF